MLVRPNFIAREPPLYNVQILYNYSLAELLPPAGNPVATGFLWEPTASSVSLWDEAIWGSGQVFPTNVLGGSWGVGRSMAIAIKGKSTEETILLSWDVMWNDGGFI